MKVLDKGDMWLQWRIVSFQTHWHTYCNAQEVADITTNPHSPYCTVPWEKTIWKKLFQMKMVKEMTMTEIRTLTLTTLEAKCSS